MKYNKTIGFAAMALVAFTASRLINTPISHPVVATSIDGDTDENADTQKNLTAAVVSAVPTPRINYKVSSTTPQFILLSFDGSKSVSMLDETLVFEQKMQAEGKPLHFTYFINAIYFLTKETAHLYQPPQHPLGTSNIGFSDSAADIALRIKEFNTAFAEGNEIGSHSVGHFDGSAWTHDEWKQEFDIFTSLMSAVQQNNPSQPIPAPTFLSGIHGFRAPQLGVNDGLYKVLGESGFVYDTSGVEANDGWPKKDSNGIWHIPLGTVKLGPTQHPVVSMDYNLWYHQSNAKEETTKGTPLWNTYYNEIETAYMNHFNESYTGNRGPFVIGNHFSKWNDGVYWEAMKTFAESVCGKPDVRCVTFKDVVDYLNTTGAPPIIN